MKRIASHLHRNLVAYLALFVALGGTGYATGSKLLPRNSVGSAQVINRSLLAKDFKRGQVPRGAQGARGPAGAAGVNGTTGAKGTTGATGPSTGAAGGDLEGNYPAPTIKNGAVTPAKLGPAEEWHMVGEPGQAPFNDTCASGFFDVTWMNYPGSSTLNRVGYYKDPYGRVNLKGVISDGCLGGSTNADQALFFLPAGYRPSQTEIQVAQSLAGLVQVRIDSNGKIRVPGSVPKGTDQWLSLDGLSFTAAP